jgi:hypothetical protein
MNLFRTFDMVSFWVGFAVASVFWWMVIFIRPQLQKIMQSVSEQREAARLAASSSLEDSHRRRVLMQAKGMHLAAPLFALDELIEPPRVFAPTPFIEPGMPPLAENCINTSLPYTPAWAELATCYSPTTFSLPQILAGGANIMVIGAPGTGKTVALADLAIAVCNREARAETLVGRVPFLLHVADLNLPFKPKSETPEENLTPLITYLEETASVFEVSSIPAFVQNAFTSGRALLILDGVDELPPIAVQEAAAYLRGLMNAYPQTLIVTTGSPEYFNGFAATLGFTPVGIRPWNAESQQAFMARWADLWERYVMVEAWAQTELALMEPLLINQWIQNDNINLTPLELTLKVWGAYAGDLRGPRPMDFIETHIRRLTPEKTPTEALETLAMQVSLSGEAIFDKKQANDWVKSFELPEEVPAEEMPVAQESGEGESAPTENAEEGKKPADKKKAPAAAPRVSVLGKMAQSGLLVATVNQKMRFAHPVFGGYLSGKALRNYNASDTMLMQPSWSGRTLTMRYMAAFGDGTPLANGLLHHDDPILRNSLFTAARLLRDAPKQTAWRGAVMKELVGLIQIDTLPTALRAQGICALVASGDPGAATVFRQLINSPSGEVRRLAALGSGAIRDPKATEGVYGLLSDASLMVRQAACLALVAIGTPQALEGVAQALVNGDEEMRRAAAEALANLPGEGHATLQEGVSAEDILIRRACVYGLARLDADWATETLIRLQTEDDQWVVRNLSVELLEARQGLSPRVPRPLPAPSKAVWLIEFAGRFGMGITPGQPATDVLLLAFKSEVEEERMAALNYLRRMPSEGVMSALYHAYYGGSYELREAAFNVLWEMAAGGFELPNPTKYGLG